MPTYDYKCPHCGREEEITKPLSKLYDDEKCRLCGKTMEKQLSAPAFHLKGSGWYVTDYKDSGRKKGTKNEDDS